MNSSFISEQSHSAAALCRPRCRGLRQLQPGLFFILSVHPTREWAKFTIMKLHCYTGEVFGPRQLFFTGWATFARGRTGFASAPHTELLRRAGGLFWCRGLVPNLVLHDECCSHCSLGLRIQNSWAVTPLTGGSSNQSGFRTNVAAPVATPSVNVLSPHQGLKQCGCKNTQRGKAFQPEFQPRAFTPAQSSCGTQCQGTLQRPEV